MATTRAAAWGLGCIGLALFGLGACSKKDDAGQGTACPSRYQELPGYQTQSDQTCTCPATAAGGTVWGDGIYTTDSSPCTAAIHVGAIGRNGGVVSMKLAKGCGAYSGSSKNGVSTSGWGSFDTSFIFPGFGSGTCSSGGAASTDCPAVFNRIPNLAKDTSLSCRCPPGPTGAVWGDGIYTQDSSICNAALHAGVIDANGGMVTAKAAGGCAKYNGSNKNGVASSGWGSFDGSFYFPKKGDGTCQK